MPRASRSICRCAVTDEKGQPAPATLAVSVVEDSPMGSTGKPAPSLPTDFLLTSELQNAEDLENADFYLSDGRVASAGRDKTPPTVALDLLLGTRGWRPIGEGMGMPGGLADGQQEGAEAVRLASLGGARGRPTCTTTAGKSARPMKRRWPIIKPAAPPCSTR